MNETAAQLIWIGHLAGTLYMTGLIWFVQCVHYPLMGRVATERYVDYQESHMRRTGWVVAPAMLLEAFTAAALLYVRPDILSFAMALTNFGMLLLIWVSTAALQVPCHNRLVRGFDPVMHGRLVRSNWIRTILWTARAILLLSVLWF